MEIQDNEPWSGNDVDEVLKNESAGGQDGGGDERPVAVNLATKAETCNIAAVTKIDLLAGVTARFKQRLESILLECKPIGHVQWILGRLRPLQPYFELSWN